MTRNRLALPRDAGLLPARLAAWHRDHLVGARLRLPGPWPGPVSRSDLIVGAGCEEDGDDLVRARTLPDLVGPGLAVVVVGLNPSKVAADRGVPFVGATNRFWPAARDAGLVAADRDPWAAFAGGVGFTDLVKRATPRADGLRATEYRDGARRLRAVVEWLAPGVVCFAGLTGYRRAVDPDATVGIQPTQFGGVPAYVMPNPSGANAHATRAALVAHFTAVRDLGGPR